MIRKEQRNIMHWNHVSRSMYLIHSSPVQQCEYITLDGHETDYVTGRKQMVLRLETVSTQTPGTRTDLSDNEPRDDAGKILTVVCLGTVFVLDKQDSQNCSNQLESGLISFSSFVPDSQKNHCQNSNGYTVLYVTSAYLQRYQKV